MRIAFLVYGFPNLSETFILNQVTGLLDAGHEVDIHASGPGDGTKVHPDVQHYRLLERTHYRNIPGRYLFRAVKAAGRVARNRHRVRRGVLAGALNARAHGRRALSLSLLYHYLTLLDHEPYDIVHCQFATLGSMAVALRDIGAMGGSRLIVSVRGSDLTAPPRSLEYQDVFRKVDLFLPVCETFRAQLIERGCDPRKILVHHSGIQVSRFPYTERRRAGGEATRVLAIGRLVEKKGLAYAIQAIARVKASGRPVRLQVVGDGPLRDNLQQTIEGLGLGGDVEMVGPRTQDDVVTLLREAHLLVAPSVTAGSGDQEGIPNVLKEAMATGIPVIATRHSGIPELVADGESGFLVPERDVEALADRLTYLIDHPERWIDMGRAGRARVEAAFDSDALNAELITLYEEIAHPDPLTARSGPA